MLVFKRERGVVLLIFLLPLCLGIGAVAFGIGASRSSDAQYRSRQSELEALNSAKDALIAYTVTYADNYPPTGAGPGHFPCPDLDPQDDDVSTNDGPNPPCRSGARYYGRFPRFTFTRDESKNSGLLTPAHQHKLLEFYTPRSHDDQRLWYAISPSFVNNPVQNPIDLASEGDLIVDGHPVVAVILAPGAELRQLGQFRPSDSITDYLDGMNAWLDHQFSSRMGSQGNDLISVVRIGDFMPEVRSRIAGTIIQWLEEFHSSYCGSSGAPCYPFAGVDDHCVRGSLDGTLPIFSGDCGHGLVSDGQLDGVPAERHWFVKLGWSRFFDYQIDSACLSGASCLISWVEAASQYQSIGRISGSLGQIYVRVVGRS